MNTENLIFLLLVVGGLLAMFSMHRRGHAHGGGGGMGCCGGGHDHGGKRDHEHSSIDEPKQGTKPLIGKPGQDAGAQEPAAMGAGKHRGC